MTNIISYDIGPPSEVSKLPPRGNRQQLEERKQKAGAKEYTPAEVYQDSEPLGRKDN